MQRLVRPIGLERHDLRAVLVRAGELQAAQQVPEEALRGAEL